MEMPIPERGGDLRRRPLHLETVASFLYFGMISLTLKNGCKFSPFGTSATLECFPLHRHMGSCYELTSGTPCHLRIRGVHRPRLREAVAHRVETVI
jgi:hypothetical protein